MLRSFLKCFLVALFLLTAFTKANCLYAQSDFEPEYQYRVLEVRSSCRAPTTDCNYWSTSTHIKFDNGLKGWTSTEWRHESQAKEQIAKQTTTQGFVNILPGGIDQIMTYNFSGEDIKMRTPQYKLLSQEGCTSYTTLSIDEKYNFDNTPKIISVTENIESIFHWFSTENKYVYIIELDNGKRFATKPRHINWDRDMLKYWSPDAKVIICGNSKNSCLLNVDSFKLKSDSKYTELYLISDLEIIN